MPTETDTARTNCERYIQGRVVGDAADHLRPYFGPSDELYAEASDETLEALESIFRRPNTNLS
ncbi:hypothetical protein ACJ73_02293 [Blastomyces percursus]|uniref:Uncharacterized protein n=1 Tax=Blastomyces percursus TaxID=1658174 RepID=A0A1J9QBV9_9EURO|nr:hypothetical protein ACJ73_02293 [Blastomyces percursus]